MLPTSLLDASAAVCAAARFLVRDLHAPIDAKASYRQQLTATAAPRLLATAVLDDAHPDVRGEAVRLPASWRQTFNHRQAQPSAPQLARLRERLDFHEAALPDDLARFLRFCLTTSAP